MKFSYDEQADVLYLTFRVPSGKTEYIETENGDILRIDDRSGLVIGVTVQLFLYRIRQGEAIDIPEIGAVPFNDITRTLLAQRIAGGKKKR